MARNVKTDPVEVRRPRRSVTTISSKHQVTIPADAFKEAGLASGERLKVESAGAGRVILTRLVDVVDELSGSLSTGGRLRRTIDEVRDSWS